MTVDSGEPEILLPVSFIMNATKQLIDYSFDVSYISVSLLLIRFSVWIYILLHSISFIFILFISIPGSTFISLPSIFITNLVCNAV